MSTDLIAVTIGIGAEHSALAQHAAERMRRFAGIDVRILNESDLQRMAVRRPPHLKFRLFDLVDSENVLFFDADAFCLRPWNPLPYCNRAELVAVRGFWFDPWVRKHGLVYKLGPDVFNAGFFFCNRTHHSRLLRLAESLQTEDDLFHKLSSPDEIALNAARTCLETPIALLDRRYNWLQYGRGNLAANAGVVIAHACDAHLRRHYLESRLPSSDIPATHVDECVPRDLAGKTLLYTRVGHDVRPLELRADGTIGEGGGAAELFYHVYADAGVRRLVIGGLLDETCTLTQDAKGVWRGRWSHHECMPVVLETHRAQTIVDLVNQRSDAIADGDLKGVEIGVFRGESSAILLAGLPSLTLYMVDPWREVTQDTDYRRTNAASALMKQDMFDESMQQAASRTAFAASRRTLFPCQEKAAAEFVPDNLAFVFVDGDHSYTGTYSAIETWRPKLSSRGLMCGHDYEHPAFPGVKQAVDDFARLHRLTVCTGVDLMWWYEHS